MEEGWGGDDDGAVDTDSEKEAPTTDVTAGGRSNHPDGHADTNGDKGQDSRKAKCRIGRIARSGGKSRLIGVAPSARTCRVSRF